MTSLQIPKSFRRSGVPGPGEMTMAFAPVAATTSRQFVAVLSITTGVRAVTFAMSWLRLKVNESLLSMSKTFIGESSLRSIRCLADWSPGQARYSYRTRTTAADLCMLVCSNVSTQATAATVRARRYLAASRFAASALEGLW